MYGRETQTQLSILERIRPKQVGRHEGNSGDFLARHEYEAKLVARAGRPGLEKVAPYLFKRATDERALRHALDYLARYGGQAPGPNGLRYEDLPSDGERWAFCRTLRDALRAGEYHPGPEKVVLIPKGGDRGDRAIALQNIAERVVQRSVLSIVQPIVDPLFDEHSFGYRPGSKRTRLRALALAEHYLLDESRGIWLTQDIKDAFRNVSLARLKELVQKYLLDANATRLVGRILEGASSPGLRQGGSLSPLLLNLYLHHLLDRPWRKHHPDLPLIRVADDLLVLCRSVKEARRANGHLEKLLAGTGMSLREGREMAVRRLSPKCPALWLGYAIDRVEGAVRYRIAERAWESLNEKLHLAHEDLSPPRRARQIVEGWLVQMAPCRPWEDSPDGALTLPRRVAVISGESGEASLQDTARRVCKARRVSLDQGCNVLWSFRLPALGRRGDRAALRSFLQDEGVEVVFIDPLYLCLLDGARGASAANLYDIGPILRRAGEACLGAGATPVLVHHATKSAAKKKADALPELDDLAFAGVAEYVRQWVLLGRRQPYLPGSGEHRLVMAVGGSAGHSGCWQLDVSEGRLNSDLGGRRWRVRVREGGLATGTEEDPGLS